jgi:hypothetical protein
MIFFQYQQRRIIYDTSSNYIAKKIPEKNTLMKRPLRMGSGKAFL